VGGIGRLEERDGGGREDGIGRKEGGRKREEGGRRDDPDPDPTL